MNFYLVCRVAEDKNFFVDLIYAAFQAKSVYGIEVHLTFIGAIESQALYRTLLRLIEVLEIDRQIEFTKRSIRYEEMKSFIQDGYFINLSIGDFVGYSGIESLKQGLKTIIYNVDKTYVSWPKSYPLGFCKDYQSLIDLITKIKNNKEEFDAELVCENKRLLDNYYLNNTEHQLLRSLM